MGKAKNGSARVIEVTLCPFPETSSNHLNGLIRTACRRRLIGSEQIHLCKSFEVGVEVYEDVELPTTATRPRFTLHC